MSNTRMLDVGDVVSGREGRVGIIVATGSQAGPTVFTLPDGPETLWAPGFTRRVIEREALAALAVERSTGLSGSSSKM